MTHVTHVTSPAPGLPAPATPGAAGGPPGPPPPARPGQRHRLVRAAHVRGPAWADMKLPHTSSLYSDMQAIFVMLDDVVQFSVKAPTYFISLKFFKWDTCHQRSSLIFTEWSFKYLCQPNCLTITVLWTRVPFHVERRYLQCLNTLVLCNIVKHRLHVC